MQFGRNKDVQVAKNILLGNNCFKCKYATEIWLVTNNEIKCKKTKKINSMYYTCYRWMKPKDADVIVEREYYRKKYIRDREFLARIREAYRTIKEEYY